MRKERSGRFRARRQAGLPAGRAGNLFTDRLSLRIARHGTVKESMGNSEPRGPNGAGGGKVRVNDLPTDLFFFFLTLMGVGHCITQQEPLLEHSTVAPWYDGSEIIYHA